MKTRVFAVYDRAARIYSHPFYVPREEMAIRAFTDAINSPAHEFGKHPQDYSLFLLAEFDDSLGSHLPEAPGPKLIISGLTALKTPSYDDQPDLLKESSNG